MNKTKEERMINKIRDAEQLLEIGYKMLNEVKEECCILNCYYELTSKLYEDKKTHYF